MTKVWMGWNELSSAIASHELAIDGPKGLVAIAPQWLGLSGLAHIKKSSAGSRVRP